MSFGRLPVFNRDKVLIFLDEFVLLELSHLLKFLIDLLPLELGLRPLGVLVLIWDETAVILDPMAMKNYRRGRLTY